jgi:hypothetical protein
MTLSAIYSKCADIASSVAKGNADEMTGYGMGCGAWGTAEV